MIEQDALRLIGKRLERTMPITEMAPLPSDLLRLVRELREREDDARRPCTRLPAAA